MFGAAVGVDIIHAVVVVVGGAVVVAVVVATGCDCWLLVAFRWLLVVGNC